MNDTKKDDAKTPFAHKKINECTLGARLRTLREVEELTQDDVARLARVRVEYVYALEEGRFDDLPAPVYVRGFLRMIARVLSARAEQLVVLYDREVGIKENVHKAQNPGEHDATGPLAKKIHLYRALLTPRQVFSVLSIALVLGGVFYLYTVLHSFVSAPFIVVATPAEGVTVETAEVVVSGTTDPAAVLSVGGEDVIVGQDGHFETQVFLQNGINDIVLSATNRFDKTTEKTVSVRYASAQPHMQPQPAVQVPDTVRLAVRVIDARTWLDISVDGVSVVTQTVEAGFEQVFEGKEIVVTSGGGARTMVARDGGDFGALADAPGLVKDVRFTVSTSAESTDGQ